MHPLLQQLVTGNRFAGLEVEFLPQEIRMQLVILKRKGQLVTIEKTVEHISSVESLKNDLPKDIPLQLAFTGKGVLLRRIAADPSADMKSMLSKALPNASAKDFYLQVTPAARDEVFVSVLRKNAVDEIFQQLKEQQFAVTGCSIGPLAITKLLPLLDADITSIHAGAQTLLFEDGKPAEVFTAEEETKHTYSPGGQTISSSLLLAFAAAFQQLLPEENRLSASIDSLENAAADFRQSRIFKTGVAALLVCTLSLLLANFFFFSHYRARVNELEEQLQTDGGAYTEWQALQQQVASRRAFLSHAGLLEKAHYAYYADQLAAELPAEIQLSRLAMSPRLKLPEEDTIGFRPGRLAISGSCSQSIVLNRWLQLIKEKSWVRSAALLSYVQDRSMAQGVFEIELEIE